MHEIKLTDAVLERAARRRDSIHPFGDFDSTRTALLVVDMQNRPCQLPAKVIEDHLPGIGKKFKRAAEGRRGVTAWVERPGELALGDTLTLFIPDQRGWAPGA